MTATPIAPGIPGHELDHFVASGGFGDVFAYTDNINRLVAVKVLRLTAMTPERLAEFRVEASRMAGLEHAYIVRVYGFGQAEDGRPYISMEYCADHLGNRARGGTMSVLDVLRYSVKIAAAVDAAHKADLFHRDIKPANVLIKRDGEPALTDFGIAGGRAAGESDSRGASLRYAAREVIAQESDGDERSDIYSLGAMTFALLTGRSPVEVQGGDNSEPALVARALGGVSATTGRSEVPESLERVIARALKPQPTSRYSTAMAYARALQAVEVELGFSPTVVSFAADTQRIAQAPPQMDDDEDSTRFAMPQRLDPSGRGGGPGRSEAPTARPVPSVQATPALALGETGTLDRPAVDHTVVRGDQAPRAAMPAAPEPEASDHPAARSKVAVLVGAGVALAVLGVGIALVGGGDPDGAPTEVAATAQPGDDGLDGLFSQPTVPSDVTVVREVGGVMVRWSADPIDGATYVVTVTAGPLADTADGSVATAEAAMTLDDADDAAQVCVRVLAVVDGTSSAPSREACTR
jgi:hypothetical protein